MKILNYVLAVLFLIFAIVQYNDPDPWKWMLLYFFVSAVSLLAARERYNRLLILAGLAILGIEAFRLYPEFSSWIENGMPSITESMKASSPHVEFVREFLGLILCFIVMIFHYFQMRKRQLIQTT